MQIRVLLFDGQRGRESLQVGEGKQGRPLPDRIRSWAGIHYAGMFQFQIAESNSDRPGQGWCIGMLALFPLFLKTPEP